MNQIQFFEKKMNGKRRMKMNILSSMLGKCLDNNNNKSCAVEAAMVSYTV